MAASTNLSAATVEVAPGATAAVTLRVRNTATVVDQMTFEVIGDAKEWTRIEPPILSLFPNDEGTVEITFAPPKLASVPAGPMPFGIKVAPTEDAEGSAVEEGTLRIGVFYDVSAELVPRTSRGRRQATHDLAIDNRSNVAYRAAVTGTDKDLHLGFSSRPPSVDVAAGTAGFAKLRVRPRRRFWRGPAKTLAFQVALEPDAGLAGLGLEPSDPVVPGPGRDPSAVGQKGAPGPTTGSGPSPALTPPPPPPPGEPTTQLSAEVPVPAPTVVLDGTFVQEALLPRWLLKVLALIVVLALIAALLWLTLVKPQIKAAAKNQVNKQLAAAGITTTTSTTLAPGVTAPPTTAAGGSAPTTAAAGASPPAGGGGSGSSPTATTTLPASSALSGNPLSGRLQASGDGTLSFTVPHGKTFQLTDVILENPNGDSGVLVLARDGTVLLQTSMTNFRDLDYHLVAPIIFTSSQQMQMTITGCTDVCQPGVFYSGYMR